jgi:hypothetical protein
MGYIDLIVFVIIALKVVADAGDWFDILQGQASHENWLANRQFDFVFGLLFVGVLGLTALLIIPALTSSAAVAPSSRSLTKTTARTGHVRVTAKVTAKSAHKLRVHR